MDDRDKETSALALYVEILRRRWREFFTAVNLALVIMFFHTLSQTKIYESSFLLLIGKEEKPQIINQERDTGKSDTTDELDTQLQVLRTLPIISKATDALHAQYPQLEPSSIVADLSIKQLGKSGVVTVSYRDTDPDRLVKVLSQLSKTYVDFSLTNRRSQVTSAITFIEAKLPEAQRDLEVRSQELANFRKRNNLVDPNQVSETLSKALADLRQQEYITVATLRQGQALYETLEQRLNLLSPNSALASASLSQDPTYLSLLKDYQEAEKMYSLGAIRFTDQAPPTQVLKQKKNELRRLLSEQAQQILGKNLNTVGIQRLNALQITQVGQLLEAENTLRVQEARLLALQSIRDTLEWNFKSVPDLQQKYDSLSRNVKVSTENVIRLLTKLEEFRILEAQESAIWKVVQEPYPPGKPISPNLKLNMIIGFVLGLMLGGVVVYACENLDSRLRTIKSVRKFLDLRPLAVLPKIDKLILRPSQFPLRHRFDQANSNSALQKQWLSFQAAIQNLFLNLKLVGATESLKVLGFTSTTFGEGKTTTIRHLGVCAAELGCKVLLIDSDLHKPELHLGFIPVHQKGLLSIINSGATWVDTVQETHQAGLYLLATESVPENPLVLLSSSRMKQIMIEFRDHYDLILIDLPPLNGSPESHAAASLLDACVLLINLEVATQETLEISTESLNYFHENTIGIVYNMTRKT